MLFVCHSLGGLVVKKVPLPVVLFGAMELKSLFRLWSKQKASRDTKPSVDPPKALHFSLHRIEGVSVQGLDMLSLVLSGVSV